MSNKRRALSPVIATVILAGVVLTIGGAIWSYSLGAATVTAEAYVSDTMSLLYEMQERFDVEHVVYDATNDVLKVWVYNYGEVNVTVDIYVTLGSTIAESTENHLIEAYNTTRIEVDFSLNPLLSQDQVAIKVYSRRQNIAYQMFYVP
jgi:FlaG/FlaF family flagellin (archaellin)